MTELRLILLIIGIAIIALVYFLGTRGAARARSPNGSPRRQAPELGDLEQNAATARTEPTLSEEMADAGVAHEHQSAGDTHEVVADDDPEPAAAADDTPPASAPPPDKIVMFHLLPLEGETFAASTLVSALRAAGLRYGHHSIFHRFSGEGNPGPDTAPVFSVANILKPGSFDLDTLTETQLKGVSLVLVLPGPEDPVAAFADMLATGRRLAVTLDGRLVDGTGSPVSRQAAGHMREEIINYQHAHSLNQAQDMQHDML